MQKRKLKFWSIIGLKFSLLGDILKLSRTKAYISK